MRSKEEKSRTQKEKDSEERSYRCAKCWKLARHYVFPMTCGSGGSKSRLAKAAGAESPAQIRNDKLHAVL